MGQPICMSQSHVHWGEIVTSNHQTVHPCEITMRTDFILQTKDGKRTHCQLPLQTVKAFMENFTDQTRITTRDHFDDQDDALDCIFDEVTKETLTSTSLQFWCTKEPGVGPHLTAMRCVYNGTHMIDAFLTFDLETTSYKPGVTTNAEQSKVKNE